VIETNVTQNLFNRHIQPLFLGHTSGGANGTTTDPTKHATIRV
jgi:hypothetical protein